MRPSFFLVSLVSTVLAFPAAAQISESHAAPKAPDKNASAFTPLTHASSSTTFVGGNDNCATPDVLIGQGGFAVDTTAATTSLQFSACSAITRDVWYAWTPSITGNGIVSDCGGTSGADSVIAAWPSTPGQCPIAGTQIACNDDTCSFESQILFPVTAGTTYLLEIGTFNNSTGFTGSFTATVNVPPTNDSCTNPSVLVGNGPFAYDTTNATAGVEGQAEAACFSFGTTAIADDVWFTWTATFTGAAQIATCGSPGDTKIAAYLGAGCPTTTALACSDDVCGSQSVVCIPVSLGTTYTIQAGDFSSFFPGPAAFSITQQSIPTGCQYDNGSSETSLGLTTGGRTMWLQRFGTVGQNATITSVSTAWGTVVLGGSPPDGTPVSVTVYEDPNDDGDPTDGVLVSRTASVLVGGDTDVFQTITLSSPISLSGIYFVGAEVAHTAGQFPAPFDRDSCPSGSGGRAWVVGSATGALNFNNLTANSFPPTELDSIGSPGVWLLRANCSGGIAPSIFCSGDGTSTACPCGNTGAPGNGCANSFNANGARLAATGTAQIAGGTLTLVGTGMPNSSVLYFQGTAQTSTIFGDGLRCAGGAIVRLATKSNVAGASKYPIGADLPIAQQGLVTTPGTRTYQAWYRNAAAFCTASTFNLTNGLLVTWN